MTLFRCNHFTSQTSFTISALQTNEGETMKLIIAIAMVTSVFASTIETRRYDLVGYKRNLTLYKLGANMTGMAVYISGRIERSGGKRENEPVIVFKNIFQPDENGRYKVLIGFPTSGLPVATGSIKTFKMKPQKAIEYDYSGSKKGLFKEVFAFFNNYPTTNERKLTGEVHITVDPYNTSLYDITCKVEYIVD